MRISVLIVEPGREDHVARHGITIPEVREIVYGSHLVERTRENRFLLIGQTVGGRFLAVIVASRGAGTFGLVTAREATESERRRYRARRRG